MAAPPALPWGRAPSPPPKRARTEGGVEASAPPTSAWARMAAKPPSAYNLEAGTRLEARCGRCVRLLRPSRHDAGSKGPVALLPGLTRCIASRACQVAWDFKFDGDDAGGDQPRTFTKARLLRRFYAGALVCATRLRQLLLRRRG